jgi:hypothetical protein
MSTNPNILHYLSLSTAAKEVRGVYTSGVTFMDAYPALKPIEYDSYLRHYISNNTPFIFEKRPLLGEMISQYLADKLRIDPADVKIIGSAKTGFSMDPSNYGRPFGVLSDLDFALINEELFSKAIDEFSLWATRYEGGKEQPLNEREKMYWEENKVLVANNIKKGFIDSYKIPNRESYPIVRNLNSALSLIFLNLRQQQHISIKRVSARIYKNKISYYKRIRLNTQHIFELVGKKI